MFVLVKVLLKLSFRFQETNRRKVYSVPMKLLSSLKTIFYFQNKNNLVRKPILPLFSMRTAYGCVTIRGQLQLRVKVEAIQGASTSFEKILKIGLLRF